MAERPFEIIEHTADIGLRIFAATLPDLFINAVHGLFHLIAPQLTICDQPLPFPPPPRLKKIELSAPTQEELLVYWLNEFIFYFFTKDLFPAAMKIAELADDFLLAEIDFKKRSRACPVAMEIKAATYHGLSISRKSGSYRAEVILDV